MTGGDDRCVTDRPADGAPLNGRPAPTRTDDRRQDPRIHEQKNIKCLERINSVCETNRSFDSCHSCKRLVPSCLHELHESDFCLFHVSNLSGLNFRIFLLMYPGSMTIATIATPPPRSRFPGRQLGHLRVVGEEGATDTSSRSTGPSGGKT